MRPLVFSVASSIWLVLAGCTSREYPETRATDHVDAYHGQRVPDPYRWLEALEAPATTQWVDAQNAFTEAYLEKLPSRADFARRLTRLIDYERYGIPEHRAGRYVYAHNTGRQEQDVYWVTPDPSVRGRVLLDPNELSADGTVSVGGVSLSPDGKWLAYSLSDGGSDWNTWRVRDVQSGDDTDDVLQGIKFSDVSWSADSGGFVYSRYPGAAPAFDDSRQVSIWYHTLGAPQSDDPLIYAVSDHATRDPYGWITYDGRYLVIDLFDGYQTNAIYYQLLEDGRPTGPVVRLLDDWDARYEFLDNEGERFLFRTTRDAPLGRVVAIDLASPGYGDWLEIVPESAAAIESASRVGSSLIVQYVTDAHSRVREFDLSGNLEREIELPGIGSVSGFEGRSEDRSTFYAYTDFTTPRTVFRYDLSTGRSEAIHRPSVGFDAGDYRTRQVFSSSRDGTRVPMYIVHKEGLVADGARPTVLYGYGGFNISMLPRYSPVRMAWLEVGGVYALANLRGGGEYGEAWHIAGTGLDKQNVFDDFIGAAEWLLENRYTSPDRLAIWGHSNGGLLVGAVSNQRPDLFAAAVPGVGVMDMLRYHTASANARQWSSEIGLSEVEEQFRALYAYSPYHNVRTGVCYPSTLVMADANDDRVVPWHSYKYAAALQAAQGCRNPVLIRIETRTGHGAGAATSKIIEEHADQWAFLAHALGLE